MESRWNSVQNIIDALTIGVVSIGQVNDYPVESTLFQILQSYFQSVGQVQMVFERERFDNHHGESSFSLLRTTEGNAHYSQKP